MKKFVLMIFHGTSPLPGTDRWKALPPEEQKSIYADYEALNKTPGFSPGFPMGLPSAAKTVRIRDGKVETRSGPYLSEGAGGYAVIEAESLEAAIELASRIPAARLGGAIEVREVEKYW